MITKEDYDAMLIERHGQQVFDTLAKAHGWALPALEA